MIGLHVIAEQELSAPALAWARLARYWGNSFIGISPKYVEYMQSDAPAVDKAFLDAGNDVINHIIGFDKQETIEVRFNRAVNYYEYCCVRNRESSVNWPFDSAPSVADLCAWRRKQKVSLPENALTDTIVQGLSEEQQKMFTIGLEIKAETRAENYADQVKEALDYVESEIASRMQLSLDQVSETGFLDEGFVPISLDVHPEDMDDHILQDTQWTMLGDSYLAPDGTVVQYGMISSYLNAAHNIKLQMYSPERQREFSGIFQLTLMSWQQLLKIQETQP